MARLAQQVATGALTGFTLPLNITVAAAIEVDRYNRARLAEGTLVMVRPAGSTWDPEGMGWIVDSDCGYGGAVGPFTQRTVTCNGGFPTNLPPQGIDGPFTGIPPFPGMDWYSFQTKVITSAGKGYTDRLYHVHVATGAAAPPLVRPIAPVWVPGVRPYVPSETVTDHGTAARPTTSVAPHPGVSIAPGAVRPVTRIVPRQPPGPNEKERKVKSKAPNKVIEILNEVTEAGDVIDAIWDSLDKDCKKPFEQQLKGKRTWHADHVVKSEKSKRKGQKGAFLYDKPTPLEQEAIKLAAIYNCFHGANLPEALFNVLWSQKVEDYVWGQIGVKLPGRYGGAMGANKVLTNDGSAKAISDTLNQGKSWAHDFLWKTFGAG